MTPPIVADALGQLFSKQSVLEHLLAAKVAAAAAAEVPAAAQPHTQATPALPAPAAGAVSTLSAHPAASKAAGSIVPYMPPAAPPQDLAAACLRYENQQRAAAAVAVASDGTNTPTGTFDHIKFLKDVFVVQLIANPACGGPHAGSAPTSAAAAVQRGPGQQETCSAATGHLNMLSRPDYSSQDLPSPWMCPITLQPCGGSKQPFMALRPCGHVLSQKALAAITPAEKPKGGKASITAAASSSSNQQLQQDEPAGEETEQCASQACCPVCEAPFDPLKDQVLINGSQQHMDEARVKLREAAAAKATAKDRKKRKRAAAEAATGQQQHQQQVQHQRQALLPSS